MLNEVSICLVLDTGVCVSLLSAYDNEMYFKNKVCGCTQLILRYQLDYNGSHIEVLLD